MAFGGLEIQRGDRNHRYVPGQGNIWGRCTQQSGNYIMIIYGPPENWTPGSVQGITLLIHEFGHILDMRTPGSNVHTEAVQHAEALRSLVRFVWHREGNSYNHGENVNPGSLGTFSGLGVNHRSSTSYDEFWADLFASWAVNSFDANKGRVTVAPDGDLDQQQANNGLVWKEYVDSYMVGVCTNFAIRWMALH